MQDSERHWFLPWLMLILAAVYLLITRLPQGAVPAAIHLSLAVVFLTIAIPLKASGHWITVAWLVEGVALLWVAIRISSHRTIGSAALRMRVTYCAGFLRVRLCLGLGGLIAMPFWFDAGESLSFFNHNLATALIGVAAFGAQSWFALRGAIVAPRTGVGMVAVSRLLALVAVDAIAMLLSSAGDCDLAVWFAAASGFSNADFGMALIGIALLGCGRIGIAAHYSRR